MLDTFCYSIVWSILMARRGIFLFTRMGIPPTRYDRMHAPKNIEKKAPLLNIF
jgi:hypothetical protein